MKIDLEKVAKDFAWAWRGHQKAVKALEENKDTFAASRGNLLFNEERERRYLERMSEKIVETIDLVATGTLDTQEEDFWFYVMNCKWCGSYVKRKYLKSKGEWLDLLNEVQEEMGAFDICEVCGNYTVKELVAVSPDPEGEEASRELAKLKERRG